MQASKFVQLKSDITKLINHTEWRLVSSRPNDNIYLIEINDSHQRYIIDLNDNKIYNTKESTTAGAVPFDGTLHLKGDIVDNINIFTPAYQGYALTQRLMDILDVPDYGWSIVDYVNNLYLVHYNDDETTDMSLVGHLRGVLVDVVAGCIIASSYGYTPTALTNNLLVDVNNNIVLQDQNGYTHVFNDKYVIKKAFEGVILRVIYHNGEVYHLTHKKIRPMKSWWGESPYFSTLFHEAGGPKDDELFDLTKKYSPLCYVFLVVHPTLLIATKQMVNKPYVVLLNINTMYNDTNCVYDVNDVDFNLNAHLTISQESPSIVNDSYIHVPKMLTLDEANQHLQQGYYTDNVCGESLIMYKYNDLNQVINILKVNSVAYDYRFKLRNNDPNPYHQFFNLVHYSYQSLTYYPNYVNFVNKFMVYEDVDVDELKNILDTNQLLTLRQCQLTDEQKKNRLYLLKQVWFNYLLSLPYHYQKQAINYYEQFLKEREDVIGWLQRNTDLKSDKKWPERAVSLITSAKQTAQSLKANGKTKDVDQATKDVIRNFVHKEYGTSLYSLIKAMKNS
jgi:hypothetical protein